MQSNRLWSRGCLCLASLAAALSAAPVLAQNASAGGNDFWSRTDLLGDPGGVRTDLGNHGVILNITDSENLLGNTLGGVKRGATMQGVATGVLEVDTGKGFGLPGGLFHISALQIHGQPLSGRYLDNLQTANGNEAEDATRLWELWYDQQFAGGRFDLKLGQQSIDNEFITSSNSALFIDTIAGWPLIPAGDMYGGGPAYPLAALGGRGQFKPNGHTTILAGVFDDNPGGGGFSDDAQRLDRNGGRFSLNTGALLIAELQYSTKLAGLHGTYKIGGWYDTGKFEDRRFDTNGLSLADPDSTGISRSHHGDYSLYGVADQTIWKSGDKQTLNVFGRIMGAPTEQNLVDFSFNGGVVLNAPVASRPNDQAGVNLGIGHVSGRAAGLDGDAGVTRQSTEELLEFTYQATVTGWLVVQPDLQYVINPGGGIPDPNDPNRKLRNELIAGARAIVTF